MKPKTKKISYIVSGTLLGLLLLTVVLILALPTLIRWGAESWLQEQGLDAQIAEVNLDLGEGLFEVIGARGTAPDGEGFKLDGLSVRWLWHTLTDKRFVVSAVEVRGLEASVEITTEGALRIAGLALPADDAGAETAATPPEPSEWQVEVGGIGLWNTRLCYRDRVQVADEEAPLPHLADLCARWDSIVWSGNTRIGPASARPEGPLPLSLGGQLIVNDLEVVNGDTTGQLLQIGDLTLSGIGFRDLEQLDIAELAGAGIAVAYVLDPGQAPEWLSIGRLQGSTLALTDFDRLQLERFGLEDVALRQHQGSQLGNVLTRFDALSLDRIAVESLREESPVALGAISVKQLRVMERDDPGEGEAAYIAQLQDLDLERLELPDRASVRMGSLSLQSPQIWLTRGESGSWEVVEWLDGGADAGTPSTEEDEATKAALHLVLGALSVTGDGSITLDDRGVSPAYRESIEEIGFQVEALDNQSPQSESPVTLSASMGKYGKIALEGTARPFAERLHMTLKGAITGIDVGPLTGYARDMVQHHIKQGSLDAELDVKVEAGVMDTVVNLELHKLQLEPIPESEKKAEAAEELGIPLNAALSLLRDDDDGIRLKLPIAGDVASPDVSLQSILGKVMGKAIKTAIVAYYSPFGLLKLAGAVLDLATGLSFEPVTFTAGSAELASGQSGRLSEITTLLQERPQVRLALCGDLTEADFEALYPPPPPEPAATATGENDGEAEEATAGEKPEAAAPTAEEVKRVPTPEQMQGLVDLAVKRGEAVKDFLVDQGGIEAKRLILCNPTPQLKAEGAPLVTISI